ncbi:hypothetical protein DUI87_06877 [Hirundo rustica rustica]|uniref:Uncharacterized protein n=1 Tax=Hirundo rustica rustica TaxID=333673 RepID=A0A3M0KNL2_HIRRU|nr:hypothetical protein DUI87_06877 [Hirundo rustica rustica]
MESGQASGQLPSPKGGSSRPSPMLPVSLRPKEEEKGPTYRQLMGFYTLSPQQKEKKTNLGLPETQDLGETIGMSQMSLTVAEVYDPFIPPLPSYSRLPRDAPLALPRVLRCPHRTHVLTVPHVVQGMQLGGFAKMVEDQGQSSSMVPPVFEQPELPQGEFLAS